MTRANRRRACIIHPG